jgi:hypothetical protein
MVSVKPVEGKSARLKFKSGMSPRHCERSEAIHCKKAKKEWIASLRSQ